MQNTTKNKLVIVAAMLLTVSTTPFTMAASHLDKGAIRSTVLMVDGIITGANNSASAIDKRTTGSVGKTECALCYHRKLMKKQKHIDPSQSLQPFPGE